MQVAPRKGHSHRNPAVVWLGLTVTAAFGLRAYGLDRRSLRFDEAFSWRLATFPLTEMLERTGQDNHPPLYFLVLKGWVGLFGDSLLSLRGVSVVLGCLAVVGIYLFVVEAFGKAPAGAESLRNKELDELTHHYPASSLGPVLQLAPLRTPPRYRIGLFTASLVATSVFHISWARDVRMYALGTALTALSSWALLRALHAAPQRSGPWIRYGLLTLAFAYTHYYALFSIAGHLLYLAGYLFVRYNGNVLAILRAATFRKSLLAVCIVGGGWAAWLPTFLAQRAQVQDEFWTQPIHMSQVLSLPFEMFAEPREATPDQRLNIVFVTVAGIALLSLFWRPAGGEWFTFLGVIAPLGLSLLVSYFDTRVFHVRYFVFAHLFLLAAIARLIWRLPSRGRCLVCTCVIVNFLAIDVFFWTKLNLPARPGIKGAMAYLSERRGSTEPVVVSSPLYFFPALYHANGRAELYLYANEDGIVHYEGSAAILPRDVMTDAQLCALTCERMWTINTDDGMWGTQVVRVPDSWQCIGATTFPEAYRRMQGDVIVHEYVRVRKRSAHDPMGSRSAPVEIE